jgi:hypothetical protein
MTELPLVLPIAFFCCVIAFLFIDAWDRFR